MKELDESYAFTKAQSEELESLRNTVERQNTEIAQLKKALTPEPPPEGLVPYGFMLEESRQNADFWYAAGHSQEAKKKGEQVICMAQAVFAWKNAAYAMAEKVYNMTNSSNNGSKS